MTIIADSADDLTFDIVAPALVGKLGGANPLDPKTIRNYQVTFTAGRRRRQRRRLLLGTAVISFEVVASLAEVGYADADSVRKSGRKQLGFFFTAG